MLILASGRVNEAVDRSRPRGANHNLPTALVDRLPERYRVDVSGERHLQLTEQLTLPRQSSTLPIG